MGIKIRIVKDDATGEDCIPPKVMELLLGYAEHKKICSECTEAEIKHFGISAFCPIGRAFFEDLAKQPEVEEYKE
jgi:hypothetical protein